MNYFLASAFLRACVCISRRTVSIYSRATNRPKGHTTLVRIVLRALNIGLYTRTLPSLSLSQDRSRERFYERPSLILARRGGVSRDAVRNIAARPTASARRKSYYHTRQTTRFQQHVSRRDEMNVRGKLTPRRSADVIFHVGRNFPRRGGPHTQSVRRRKKLFFSGVVFSKVRNKSLAVKSVKKGISVRGRARRERIAVGRSAFEGRQSDAPLPWEIALNLLNSRPPKKEASPLSRSIEAVETAR